MIGPVNVFWFRRDLRFDDNTGLYHALKADNPVILLFIFDKDILDDLVEDDARVTFIYNELQSINLSLKDKGSRLIVKYGKPIDVWKELIHEFEIKNVFLNHDYEPYAIKRDSQIQSILKKNSITYNSFKDQVIFEKDEVVKSDGKPYVVFTPYSKVWKSKFKPNSIEPLPSALYFENFAPLEFYNILTLEDIGFQKNEISVPAREIGDITLRKYADLREIPTANGTSRLSVHLRFGTISIRKLALEAFNLSQVYLNELIWREFYQMILWHFPKVVDQNFYSKYDAVEWRNDEKEFEAWCSGKTGYPIVDAGMRELNQTGYMHNRVRMIVASFLTKHLLIDWRWGEAYFATKLLDYELASNNGGWQWAAGTGTDAQPYFRVFSPESQTKKFDQEFRYIKEWVPEFNNSSYPDPIVDHKMARDRAINTFKKALTK